MPGTNNLPESSNMCHESSSVALPERIGSPVGTVTLEDFAHTDCILFLGRNHATSSPRILHQLQECGILGVPVIIFNPLRERGFEELINPQAASEMLTLRPTRISSSYHQLGAGGDVAALMGVCKALIGAHDEAVAAGCRHLLDTAFIAEHTSGFEAFAEAARGCGWPPLERRSGLTRGAMEAVAASYGRANAAMGGYGMGITQHRTGVANVQMIANLLLPRGNIGRPGAGICAVRGHSNVQGQRTVGITAKPELARLDRLEELCGFKAPREKGMATVEACQAIIDELFGAFVSLGGKFIRAVPETAAIEAAWRKIRPTVQISTKLNRSDLIHGQIAYILPCLGRIEVDRQASGPQAVSVEDSTAHIHGSRGRQRPASPHLLCEPKIVAELAKATLPRNPRVDWDGGWRTLRGCVMP